MGATLLVCSLFALPTAAQTNQRPLRTLLPKMAKAQRVLPIKQCNPSKKSPITRKVVNQWSLLIDEDFSLFTNGSEKAPDTTHYVVDLLGGNIPASLTQEPGWTGAGVHEAGGKAMLAGGGINPGCINTPVGDYSGDLIVTFRARRTNENFTNVEEIRNATIFVNTMVGTYNNPEIANCDEPQQTCRIFAMDKGWQEFNVSVKNYSSDNTGFIQIMTYDSILIDNITVRASCDSFIAEPTVLPETNVTDNSFTVNWEPVRVASMYRLGLAQKVFTSDEDSASYYFDFENGLPSSMSTTGSVENGVGIGGSKALTLADGDEFTLPENGATIKRAEAWMTLVTPDDVNPNDLLASYVNVYMTDSKGRESSGYFLARDFYNASGYTIIIGPTDRGTTADKYVNVRLVPANFPEGVKLVIDSMTVVTNRPFEIRTIFTPDNWVNPINNEPGYVYAPKTSYTFTDLDSESEYYWTVQARRFTQNSAYTWRHAFCLTAPTVQAPTNLNPAGSYTANWLPSTKATRYIAYSYGAYIAENDEADHVVLDEPFDLVNDEVTSVTDPRNPDEYGADYAETSISALTHLPGWTGLGVTIAQGWLGAKTPEYYYTYVKTPKLSLDNDDKFKVQLKAVGSAGDYLALQLADATYYVPFDANGDLDTTVVVPEGGKDLSIRFHTYNYTLFMLDEVKIMQDLKAGNAVYTYLGQRAVNAPETSVNFDGLSAYPFDFYAYNVVACQDIEDQTAYSDPSAMMVFSLDPTAVEGVEGESTQQHEVARYTLDGRSLSHPQKGVNIVRMSDGRVVKTIVK